MADIDFPAELPPARDGQFGESILETKVSDQGEVGAPRRRNRFTRALGRFTFQLLLTGVQKDRLIEFYVTDLVRGVKAFNWTHPATSRVYEAVLPTMPAIAHLTADIWTADVDIEEI